LSDITKHATLDYHKQSIALMAGFNDTFEHLTLINESTQLAGKNRTCIELCRRQGMTLRGHRDYCAVGESYEDNPTISNKGKFRAFLDFRIETRDEENALHTSNTSQNNKLLLCIKEFMQGYIINEIRDQHIGPTYGIESDEVADSIGREQLGIVLRYTVNDKPTERLIEFIECETTHGEAICGKLL